MKTFSIPMKALSLTTLTMLALLLNGSTDEVLHASDESVSPPAAPSNLDAWPAYPSQINFGWIDNATDEDGFKLERCRQIDVLTPCADFVQVAQLPPDTDNHTDSGLNASTTYRYRLLAYNTAGNSQYSNEDAATTPAPTASPDGRPTGLAGVGFATRVDLSWTDNSTNEDVFKIGRCINLCVGGGGPFELLAVVGANATSYIDFTAASGTHYSYDVYASNAAGASAPSNVAIVDTPGFDPPAAPSDLTAVSTFAWDAEVFWTDNSFNEDGFRIERCTVYNGECVFEDVGTVGPNVTTFGDCGCLTENTTYAYRVFAFSTGGTSAPSNTAEVTTPPPPPPPPPPTNLVATPISPNQIDLTWTSSGGENYILIFMCWPDIQSTCFSETAYAYVGAEVTSYSAVGLAPGTRHYFRVAALNTTWGRDGYSNTAEAWTVAVPGPPPAPSNLAATAASTTQVNLVWQDNSFNETGFDIERCTGAGCSNFVLIEAGGAAMSGWTNSGLTPNTTYQYRVRAVNAEGNSAYSNVAAVSTSEAPPAAPSNLTTIRVGTAIQLNWNDNSSNESDFHIERCIGDASACGNSELNFSTTAPPNATSYRDSTVSRRTTYTYRVRARHLTAGHSAWTNFSTVTTK